MVWFGLVWFVCLFVGGGWLGGGWVVEWVYVHGRSGDEIGRSVRHGAGAGAGAGFVVG